MSYVETGGNLDWALKFVRTGTFPLDRSSMFASYADALAYAKMDGTDSRQMGGTAYIGQIISVYGPGVDGSTQEVAAYVIAATGEGAALQKLAQSSATGDYGQDIANLQTAMSEAQADITQIMTSIYSDAEAGTLKEATQSAAGFMSAADKTKLDGVAAGAQVNVLEGVSVQTVQGGGYSPLSVVEKIAQLDLSNYATKDDISTVFNFKGTVDSVGSLPEEGNVTGDVYLVEASSEEDAEEYVWTGSEWEKLGVTVDLSGYSTTEQMNTAISEAVTAAVQALTLASTEIGAANTIASISQTNGIVAVTPTPIQIAESQVTGLTDALAAKADAADIPETIVESVTSNDFAVTGTTDVVVGLTASDTPVTKKLTKNVAGDKLDFGGQISANGVLLTGNTGTVTSVSAGAGLTTGAENNPITGAGTLALEEIGSQTTSNEGSTYIQNITTDVYGRVTGVTSAAVPAAPTYTAADGVLLSGTEFSLADEGVTTAKIADDAVTNDKIAAVDVAKLYVAEGDTFILNGGSATV